MLTVYGIPNCNTVKKARDWLDGHGVAYQFHDFKKLGVDRASVDHWLTQQPWDKLVNRAGTTWRGLDAEVKDDIQDAASAAALMLDKTSVIRRPVLVADGKLLALGFDAATYTELFA